MPLSLPSSDGCALPQISSDDASDGLYTYILVPASLEMSSGKLAAQVLHAGRLSLLAYLKDHPGQSDAFLRENCVGSAVVLQAPHTSHLLRHYEQAQDLGLPCALFEDSGHVLPPHFDGNKVITALAIGPAPRDLIRPILKRYSLVR